MSVEELKKAVASLPSKELARFRAWFEAFDASKWDEQIEADINAGKLDKYAEEALAEHKAGLTRKL
ncbi:MAG TPA: hypothetical protein VG889_06750 [Rhizomicrobium sp.]|nr:hypothetical protein [Rhizomicrobium sp.]